MSLQDDIARAMDDRPLTRAAQDASWEKYGNENDYQRMLSAYGFARQLEGQLAELRKPEVIALVSRWASYTRNFLSEEGRAAQDLARAIVAALDDGSGS